MSSVSIREYNLSSHHQKAGLDVCMRAAHLGHSATHGGIEPPPILAMGAECPPWRRISLWGCDRASSPHRSQPFVLPLLAHQLTRAVVVHCIGALR